MKYSTDTVLLITTLKMVLIMMRESKISSNDEIRISDIAIYTNRNMIFIEFAISISLELSKHFSLIIQA